MLEAPDDSPVVLVNGARQTGKSTLVRTLEQDVRYFTFDDPAVLAAAQADPFGFIGRLMAGGYPAALSRTSERRREAWFDN
ncbi:hypothetical protein D9M71_753060 [compost metagenome]